MSMADPVTEYNCERDPNNDLHKMLKEIHPWADGSLIKDVLASTDNDVCEASALLEEMVSSEENCKRYNDFKNKDLQSITEEDLLADRNTDVAELTCLLQEGLKTNNSSVSSSDSKVMQNVALLEIPFRSVLQNSVNFPSLNNHVNSGKEQLAVDSSITSMSTADLVTEYNSERDPNNDLHKMLKEIHPWADGSLIKDILAGTDNDVCKASALLEEMVSSEENYKRYNDFKNKDLKSTAEEGVLDGNDLLVDRNMDLAELACVLQEGLKSDNSEFHHESDTDLEILLNLSGWTAFDLEQWRKMGLEPEASTESFPSVGSSTTSMSTADLVTEYNSERDPNNDLHKMLKEIHPWADGSLIKDILAGTDNDVCKTSALLEEMVSSEEDYKRDNDFKNKDLKSIAEEGVLVGNDLLADRNMDLAELACLLQEGLKSDNSEFHHESDTDLEILLNLSGWTAFDLEQWRKMGLEPEASTESFPSVGSSTTSMSTADLATEYNCEGDPNNDLHKMLKEIHPWADGRLIEDVLAGTDNNVYTASALLEEMVSSEENYKRYNDFKNKDLNPISEEGVLAGNDLLADRNMDLAELTCLQEGLKSDNSEFDDESDTDLKILLNSLNCSTIKPKWKEDDVYLVHRKKALKRMRLALYHSKAAKDAYSRGDHLSARKYSQKAREEWKVTKRLNEKAAKEILNIRNSKNDQWTLDLHGLHLAEAVTALREHLSKIESQVPNGQLVCTNGLETSLQVITGRGKHSRGEPVLPVAIRSFLTGNGYRFEETRPGVISVRPKFRQHLS